MRPLLLLAAAALLATPAHVSAEATHTVVIRGFRFDPQVLSVVPGDTVVWVNQDDFAHTVSAADLSFDSGEVPPGGTFAWTFAQPGATLYACQIHGGMVGAVLAPPS